MYCGGEAGEGGEGGEEEGELELHLERVVQSRSKREIDLE